MTETEQDVADAYVESVQAVQPGIDVDDVIIFVDFHEDMKRDHTKELTLLQSMHAVHVARRIGKVVRCSLKACDVIIARIVEKQTSAGDDAMHRAIEENITIDGVDPYTALVAGTDLDFACVIAYERKTLSDLISSTSTRSKGSREQHFDEQIGRHLVFCRATGAQPRLLLEGYAHTEMTGSSTGVQVLDHAHSGLTEIALIDNVPPWHSDGTTGSARLILKDARMIHERRLSPIGWTRMGTGEDRAATVKMAIAKKDNYDVLRWYRGALESIPLMSEERAFLIIDRWPTMLSLVRAFDVASSAKDRVGMIADITCKSRRLGDALASRVVERFYCADPANPTVPSPKTVSKPKAPKPKTVSLPKANPKTVSRPKANPKKLLTFKTGAKKRKIALESNPSAKKALMSSVSSAASTSSLSYSSSDSSSNSSSDSSSNSSESSEKETAVVYARPPKRKAAIEFTRLLRDVPEDIDEDSSSDDEDFDDSDSDEPDPYTKRGPKRRLLASDDDD